MKTEEIKSFEGWMLDAMRSAVKTSKSIVGLTSPKPWVGAVIVPQGEEHNREAWFFGATEPNGRHAEVVAIDAAKEAAKGATLFVTLEPCNHYGATPPCTEAIVKVGIRRVFVATLDPDTRVNGKGIDYLVGQGIEVNVGLLKDEAEEILRPYLHHRRFNRPFVILKLAMTLDGYIAAKDGSSKWISSEAARNEVAILRAISDAVAVGSRTVAIDNPTLRIKSPSGEVLDGIKQPKRIVFGNIPPNAKVHPAKSYTGDFNEIMHSLGSEGVLQLLVEGGAKVSFKLHSLGLIDKYIFYFAPKILGSNNGLKPFDGEGPGNIESCANMEINEIKQVGPDLRIEFSKKDI